jgi:hypothetical protein
MIGAGAAFRKLPPRNVPRPFAVPQQREARFVPRCNKRDVGITHRLDRLEPSLLVVGLL